jgi:RNA polymerase sigma-70 factor, ECF subfamily
MVAQFNTLLLSQRDVTIDPATHTEPLFRQLFLDYFEGLYAYAFTLVKNNDDAKDVVQKAYIKLWEKRTSLALPSSARPYLFTSVYHLSLNRIRDKKRREGAYQSDVPAAPETFISTVEQKEVRLRIDAAISALPPQCREVFMKSRMEGKRYSEIARELQLSVKTVEGHMGKALKVLRENLSDLKGPYAILFLLLFLN